MKYKDPFKQREIEKYGRPIPSRELILQVLSDQGPLRYKAIAKALKLSKEDDLVALKRRLRAMERDGQILFNRRRNYVPVSRADLIPGRIIGHPDGFGFLKPDDGKDDLFLSAKQMRSLLHGDRALVSAIGLDPKGRREAVLVEVLERNTEQIIGRYFIESNIGFVVPDNSRISQDVMIAPENLNDAEPGQIVVTAILEQPNKHSQPVGKIVEVLGEHMAPGMEVDIAVRSHNLPHEWPEEVREAADHLGHEVEEADKEGRVDLRTVPLMTIDGEDARDFDDAVYCEREDNHWRLLVAIADVSAYVQAGSPLDQEAWNRGTSVYFPGQVIPMLPEILSNGLCSLNPKVDRLCMVCDMKINEQGEVFDYTFFEGLMHSAARLTYEKVAAMVVDRDMDLRREYGDLAYNLDDLYALYKILLQSRKKRGAMDFETTETQIVFGEDRKIEHILPRVRNDAHKIIEECMIAANVCAARFLVKHKIPGLHRTHIGPKTESLSEVREFLQSIGLSLKGGDDPQPGDYAKLLDYVQGRPDFHLIQTVLLRSLSQAEYMADAEGHFGLAHKHYAHFTSPIRRYPDLLVHRAIRYVLQYKGDKKQLTKDYYYTPKDMAELGEHCSTAERRADDATRDATSWLKCEFIQDKIGEVYAGIITGVTSFGLFVELQDFYVDGLLHVTELGNDYFHFDPVYHQMTGERSGKKYRLGDSVTIEVARVDLDERKIDFILPEEQTVKASAQKRKR